MIITRPLLMEHMFLKGQEQPITPEDAELLYQHVVAGEAVFYKGIQVAALWFIEVTKTTLVGQAVFKDTAQKVMLPIVRRTNDYITSLANKGYHRFEMRVPCHFTKALKWGKIIGFTQEGIMRAYDQNRTDYVLLARIA